MGSHGAVEKVRQLRSRPVVELTYSRVRSARHPACGLAGHGSAEPPWPKSLRKPKAASRMRAAFLNSPFSF